jgi:hypothetical protein
MLWDSLKSESIVSVLYKGVKIVAVLAFPFAPAWLSILNYVSYQAGDSISWHPLH